MMQNGIVGASNYRRAMLFTASIASALPVAAMAETRGGVDTSVGAIAASNPYLVNGNDTGEVGANVTLRPWLNLTEDDTSVTLDGAVYLESFFDGDRIEESVQAGASMEHRANERTTVTAGIGFLTSESGARRYFGGPNLGNLEPGEFPDSPVIDPTLGTLAGRTTRLDVNSGVEHQVSENSTLSLSAGVGLTTVSSGQGEDYRDASLAGSYARSLNERTSLRASVNAGYADYLDRRAGDGQYVTGLVGIDRQVTESMYASVQVGLSYATIETLLNSRNESVDWAAMVDICDLLARARVCVTGSRAAQPTSDGLSTVSAIGVSYSRPVGPDGDVSMNANFSRSSGFQNLGILAARQRSEIANVSGTYSHRLGERLSAFFTPGYTATRDDFNGHSENFEVTAGITYRFGSTR